MSDESKNGSLREGLISIPTPTASRDFDSQVLAAIDRRSMPSWRTITRALRPALAGAAISLPLMLGWINLGDREHSRIPTGATAGYVDASESFLDQPHLTPASVRSLARLAGIEERPAVIVPPRSSIDRHDSQGRIL